MPRKKFQIFTGDNSNLTIAQAKQRYAPVLSTLELKSLNADLIEDLRTVENKLKELISNEHLRHRKLIWYWISCLRKNNDYADYCEAKRKSKQKVVSVLNSMYPPTKTSKGVAQVYKDWGDIYITEFDPWFGNKEHLFLYPEKVIEESTVKQTKYGTVAVTVPKGIDDKMDLWALFNKFYKSDYKKYMNYKPEYELSCKPTMEQISMLEMAGLIVDLREYEYQEEDDPEEEAEKFKNKSKAEVEFMKSEFIPANIVQTLMGTTDLRYSFGLDKSWMVNDAKDLKLLRLGKLSSKDIVKNKIPYIHQLEKHLSDCIRISITGRFPA